LYDYAGNNPVKYTDQDGKNAWLVLSIVGLSFILQSDRLPEHTPVDILEINNKLANLFYDDPAKRTGVEMKNPYTRENIKSIKLEQHPLMALGAALPRGNYSESDYSNPNQIKSSSIKNTGTVLDGLNLISSVIGNLSNGHLGDVTLNLKRSGRHISSWNITLTTIDPLSGKTTGRQVLSREDALKYIDKNKDVLKNDTAFKELQNLLD